MEAQCFLSRILLLWHSIRTKFFKSRLLADGRGVVLRSFPAEFFQRNIFLATIFYFFLQLFGLHPRFYSLSGSAEKHFAFSVFANRNTLRKSHLHKTVVLTWVYGRIQHTCCRFVDPTAFRSSTMVIFCPIFNICTKVCEFFIVFEKWALPGTRKSRSALDLYKR